MEYLSEKMSSSDPHPIKLHLIKTITEDFSEKMRIGRGGYGEVYKGVLNGDEIAVKKLFPVPGVDDKAFDKEMRNLKKVQQINVIRMIGYCYEISHRDVEYKGQLVWSQVIDRAICFEYMKEGSLPKHISAESCIHDWPTTYKIINGTCQGLHHLHKGGEEKIFHLELKPENVLLDEELVPKIGDFGLSRLFGTSHTHQISIMKGTIGFMPQEYIHNQQVSQKNDVFSFGVIIFHMMAGAKCYGDYWDACHPPSFSPKFKQDFIETVLNYWKTKMEATMSYRWDKTDVLGVTKCIEIAMRCVEDDRKKRPLITEIMGELEELDSEIEGMLKEDPKPLTRQQLTNKAADSFIAFNIITDVNKYRAQLNKGILSPCSKCYINLTLRAQEEAPPNMHCDDVFIVQCIRVSEHFTSDEITEDFLMKAIAVDEVRLPIVYVALDHQPLSQ